MLLGRTFSQGRGGLKVHRLPRYVLSMTAMIVSGRFEETERRYHAYGMLLVSCRYLQRL